MSDKMIGHISQVLGAVVDVEFASGHLPDIYNALVIEKAGEAGNINLTLEVASHLGNNSVRCIAMDSTDGLQRRTPVRDTGKPISVPVGSVVLGRILNVLGETIDGGEQIQGGSYNSIHRTVPGVEDVKPATEILETD